VAFSTRRYLRSRARFGIKFGLDSMRALLRELGDPHRCAPALLVAGTNGKGSVVAYVDAVLRASGLRVGRYVSPHLVRVNERIAVAGRDITDAALARHLERVKRAADALVGRGDLDAQPTHFEVLTAAAFLEFRARSVDVMVLEVGLGARLDATNVVEPIASAIVSLDLDHEAYLGTTLRSIAREKAGVLRTGRVTVTGALPAVARQVVAQQARTLGARVVGSKGALRRHPGVRAFPGAHQLANLEVALRLTEAARAAGLPVRLERAAEAIQGARWPGRLQEIPGRPPLLLDGAHNPAAARALAAYLRGRRPFVLVFGMMADKDVAAAARSLFPLARAVVLTRPRMVRAATPAQIRRRAGAVARRSHAAPGIVSALRLARKLARPGEIVVVSGSLYLVGEALRATSAIPRARSSPSPRATRPRRGRSPAPRGRRSAPRGRR
jgi:dihydrofolate synthase / folylpolyglutamate synthase